MRDKENSLSMNSVTPNASSCCSDSHILVPVTTITGTLRPTRRICCKTVIPAFSNQVLPRGDGRAAGAPRPPGHSQQGSLTSPMSEEPGKKNQYRSLIIDNRNFCHGAPFSLRESCSYLEGVYNFLASLSAWTRSKALLTFLNDATR